MIDKLDVADYTEKLLVWWRTNSSAFLFSVGVRRAHRLCYLAQLGFVRARLCAAQELLRRAAGARPGGLRPGRAHAALQQAGVGLAFKRPSVARRTGQRYIGGERVVLCNIACIFGGVCLKYIFAYMPQK